METPWSTESPAIVRLRDPLSEVTRKERRALLGASLLGVALARTGLLPTEISALGVKLASSDQRVVLLLVAAVCAYFLVAFLAYAASDFVAWQIALREAVRARIRQHKEGSQDDEYEEMIHTAVERIMDERFPWLQRAPRLVVPVSWARGLFEFAVPVLFALYAVWVLARSAA